MENAKRRGRKVISLYLVNQATDPRITDDLLHKMLSALEKQNAQDFAPVWGDTTRFTIGEKSPGAWPLIVQDKLDVADALAYHDEENGIPVDYAETQDPLSLTQGTGPLSQETLDALSIALGHEICESLVDPFVNDWIDVPPHAPILRGQSRARFYQIPKETVDSCEGDSYLIDDVAVPNFLYPGYFDAEAKADTQFDKLGKISVPFSLDAGGYVSLRDNEGAYSTVWGERVDAMTKARVERRSRVLRARVNRLQKGRWGGKVIAVPIHGSTKASPQGPFPKKP